MSFNVHQLIKLTLRKQENLGNKNKTMPEAAELTTFSRRWLTHTVYEIKGVSPYIGWLGAFYWVRVKVRLTGIPGII